MGDGAGRTAGPERPATSRPPRVGLWGNFGSGNLGNEATLQALAANVRRLQPEAELVAICSAPLETRLLHGLDAVSISPTRRALRSGEGGRDLPPAESRGRAPATRLRRRATRALRRLAREAHGWAKAFGEARRLSALVVAGTGVLTDAGEGPFGLPHDLFKWQTAARTAGVPVLLASVGVEALDDPLARFFVRRAVAGARYVSFRDAQSREAALRAGCGQGSRVRPDLAFSLPAQALPPWAPADGPLPRVAVGLFDAFGRGRAGGGAEQAYACYLEKLAAFVAALLERGHSVRVVIGDVVYDGPVLADFEQKLRSRARPTAGRFCAPPATSVADLLRQLASVDLVVASRFHNLLLGFLFGHPAVSISYQTKNDALLERMGLAGSCQSIARLDPGLLMREFCRLASCEHSLRPRILARTAECRAELDEQYALLFGARAARD